MRYCSKFLAYLLVVQVVGISVGWAQQLIPLPDLGGGGTVPTAINVWGVVAGYSNTATATHAFSYSGGFNGTITDLGTLPGGTTSYAFGIDDTGEVVGFADDPNGNEITGQTQVAFYYKTSMQTLDSTAPIVPNSFSSPTAGFFDFEAVDVGPVAFNQVWAPGCIAITDTGNIAGVGDYYNGDGEGNPANIYPKGFVYDGSSLENISSLSPANPYIEIHCVDSYAAGCSKTAGGDTHAFCYFSGSPIDMGTLGGHYSNALGTAKGSVVGESTTASGITHAFVYSTGSMTDLGSLAGETGTSVAYGINWPASEIVGTSDAIYFGTTVPHAFIYTEADGMQDLNTLYAPLMYPAQHKGFVSLDVAYAINDYSQIVGTGEYWNGTTFSEKAFLLIPGGLPSLTSSHILTGTVGVPFSYQVKATNVPYSFTLKGTTILPPGLTLDTSTGVISGTPTLPGPYQPIILITNAAGSISSTLTITISNSGTTGSTAQTITFSAPAPHIYGDAPFTVNATATSGLPVTITVKSGPATILNKVVTLTGAGTVVLAGDQTGNASYKPAKEVTASFKVAKAGQTIATFHTISNKIFGATPFGITPPTTSSALPVVVKVKSGPAKLVGTTLSLTGVGIVTLEADQAGNANYNAASPVTTSFIVAQAPQTIAAFTTIPMHYYKDAPFTITLPTASSGLAVKVTVQAGSPAKISGNKITITGGGTVTLLANQIGNADYVAAPQVTTIFTVNPIAQTIADFKIIPAKVYGSAAFSVTAPKASSGLPVVLKIFSGPATIQKNKVTLTGAGTVALAADQPGDASYTAATEVLSPGFTVSKAAQKIAAFKTISTKTFSTTQSFIIVPPIVSSGLPVAVTVKSGPATIAGNTVTLTGTGTVTLAADQAGDANHLAAPQVTTHFVVK